MGIGAWVVLAIIVVAAVWAIGIYNGLVTLRNRFKNAFSQIDVQLKRRYDLIPNLVESVMEYNTKRESFPDNIFAGMFGFTAAELLQSTESPEERKAPKVSFS